MRKKKRGILSLKEFKSFKDQHFEKIFFALYSGLNKM